MICFPFKALKAMRKSHVSMLLCLTGIVALFCARIPIMNAVWSVRNEGAQFDGSIRVPTNSDVNEVKPLSIKAVQSLDRDQVKELHRRQLPRTRFNVSEALHLLQLFGKDVTVDIGATRVKVLELLLDATKGEAFFGGGRMFVRTRWGVRFSTYEDHLLGTVQNNRQAHPSQFLAVCGSLGLPLNTPISMSDGSQATLKDVLDDLKANYIPEGDFLWDSMAITYYCREDCWFDRFGVKRRFEDLPRDIMKYPLERSSCGGAHVIQALVLVMRVNHSRKHLTDETNNAVVSYLVNVVDTLGRTQGKDGSWEVFWFYSLKSNSQPGSFFSEDNSKLTATGHLLEVLLLLPVDMRPEQAVFERASNWLLKTQLEKSKDERWTREYHCPATHVCRSLALVSGFNPTDLKDYSGNRESK